MFWAHLYMLLYDHIYVPANFITDQKLVLEVLRLLRVGESDAPVHAAHRPLRFTWDLHRFPASFGDLGKLALVSDDVSMRDPAATEEAMRQCEKFLPFEEYAEGFESLRNVKRDESILALREGAFNPDMNLNAYGQQGGITSMMARCRECLEKIEERGKDQDFGYGRNFYYTIFGYARQGYEHPLAADFRDITGQYPDVRHDFLCAVDYVSHCLKAKIPNSTEQFRAKNITLHVIMPPDYADTVFPVRKAAMMGRPRKETNRLTLREKDMCIITKEAVVNMTAAQLESLHCSDEYEDFRHRRRQLHQLRVSDDEEAKRRASYALQDALGRYVQRIRRTLNPRGHYIDRSIGIVAKALSFGAGVTLEVYRSANKALSHISDDSVDVVKNMIDVLCLGTAEKVTKRIAGGRRFGVSLLELDEDNPLYLDPWLHPSS